MLRRPTRMIAQVVVLVALAAVPALSLAQGRAGTQGGGGARGGGERAGTMFPLEVWTFKLQSLSPKDAATLVGPYVSALPTGGVYEAGGVHAITVRGTPEILRRVDSLLKANDRPSATVTFRFQLIAASDSALRDPALAGIDAELHSLLRFAGYRLLAQGTATANDGQRFELTLGGGSSSVYQIAGFVTSVQAAGGKAAATLNVTMVENARAATGLHPGRVGGVVLATGLTIPLGQTVVIGSAASDGSVPALVLAVRPELATRP